MERSESIVNLTKAMIEFHKNVDKIFKDSKGEIPTKNGGKYSYKYASLSNVLDVIDKPLQESGLNIMQFPTGEYELETILSHVSGEFIVSRYRMAPTQNTPQGIGSCITYQRRYAIGAILNLNIEEDDDGSAATWPARGQQKQQPAQQQAENSNAKKVLTADLARKPELFAWIHKQETAAAQKGTPFKISETITRCYQVTPALVNQIINDYIDYKTTNNLL